LEQKVRKNKDDWASLAIDIQKRLEAVQEAVDGAQPSAALQDLVSKYAEYVVYLFLAGRDSHLRHYHSEYWRGSRVD
jgi:hypothetical protein